MPFDASTLTAYLMLAANFLINHPTEIAAVFGFVGSMATVIQAFRNGAKDRALEAAKEATARLAGEMISNDEKLEIAVSAVYSVLIEQLNKQVKIPAVAKTLITSLISREMVVEQVKKAWHLYVKPEQKPAA